MQALGNLASSVRGALIRLFALRGVSQAVAQPAPEIAPTIDLPAAPAAFQATHPLAAAAEPCGRVSEGDELVDVDRRPVAILRLVAQTHTVLLCNQRDRARLLSRLRPGQRGIATRLQHPAPAEPGEIDTETAFAGCCARGVAAAVAKSPHVTCKTFGRA